jgi:chromosome segregation ATPase
MFKKLLILSGLLVVVGWAFGSNAGREIWSYAQTGWKEVRTAASKVVPIEFEIKRAEDLLNNLDRTDDRLITALAAQMQAVRTGEREVETITANLEAKRSELQARNETLKNMPVSTKSSADRDLAALQLEKDFKQFKLAEAALKNKQAIFEQMQCRIKSLQEQREALKGQRADLASRVSKLKTDLDFLKVAQLKAKHAGEDFQVAEVAQLRELVDSLEGRIETSLIEHQLREEIKVGEKATVRPTSSGNITAEIESYFSSGKVAEKK